MKAATLKTICNIDYLIGYSIVIITFAFFFFKFNLFFIFLFIFWGEGELGNVFF